MEEKCTRSAAPNGVSRPLAEPAEDGPAPGASAMAEDVAIRVIQESFAMLLGATSVRYTPIEEVTAPGGA